MLNGDRYPESSLKIDFQNDYNPFILLDYSVLSLTYLRSHNLKVLGSNPSLAPNF